MAFCHYCTFERPYVRLIKILFDQSIPSTNYNNNVNNNIEQSSDNGVGGNGSGNNSDEMSSTTITEMNVKNCLSETDDTATTLLTKAQNCVSFTSGNLFKIL